MQLFQVAALLHPTDDEAETGAQTQIVIEPSWILAPSERVAGMLAARKLDEKYLAKIDRIEIHVRSF
jgi:hypothetical protein